MSYSIVAANLKKRYPPDVQALDGIDLEVPVGTVFALLGPNGAGKSTTVKVLTTLSRPDSGRAEVAGIDVLREPERVRRAVGVVAQKPGFDPAASGRENLVLQAELCGITGTTQRRRVAELLERFDLADAAGRAARTYSGGMQRRLDVAMGLLHRPQVLFLDEPTTGLDPEARSRMWEEVEGLARDERITILLTTHYLEEADRLAAEVAIVDRGRIVARGAPDALKAELEGDAVEVELAATADEPRVREALARTSVSEVTLAGRSLRARVREGAAAVPPILFALEAHGIPVASVSLARPSLDDVYLRHAGRRIAEAEVAA